ncbi:UbiA prenyltransferase [Aspergillus udagawae]|uniref:UbiA prenyltransferase n=1 Tax=Aspergillus udagawae TaxID=91492 RepID=A0ABQ1AFP9_9EURO|nr:UbiA prenyltransferase [Aspergillus udagawae]GFG11781.1 UbiA prenyltransferase [Aspergillus udagawae]
MGGKAQNGEYEARGKILSRLPPSLVPYAELMRVHRPLGYYLNTSPYVVGVAFGAAVAPTKLPATILLDRLLILVLWSLFLRSAGCVWNDVIDMDLDRQIARTSLRPLPRGAVSSWNAVMLTAGIFACGGSLLSFLPRECAIEALIEIFFALLYPFGKRFTDFPQLILVNIGWAIPMSMHSLGLDPLAYKKPTFFMFLFIALVIVMVDVVYSRQDTEEDVKVGVKSMAVRFKHSIDLLSYALFCASTGALLAAGSYSGLGIPFTVLSVGGHFGGFLYFLKTTGVGKVPQVESYAKLACLIASLFWVVGLFMEYYLRV